MRRRLGYGVGDFAFNLIFTTATLYLLYFYTDVLGLAPATAGWVFAAALVWDALFDPFMGYIANRTRTRWGSYRPYILFGAIPLAASWVLIFVPTGFTGTALVLFALAAHLLLRTLYAVVSMPYLALSATMTDSSQERGLLAGVRMIFAAACGLFSAFFTLKLVAAFGGGATGFLWVAIVYGVLASLIFMIVFANTSEVISAESEDPPSLAEMLAMLRSNRAFWLVSGATLIAAAGGTMFSKTVPYYFKYALGREDLIGPALAALTGAIAVGIPIWTAAMRFGSKRGVWLTGIAIQIVPLFAMLLLPLTTDQILIAFVVMGFGVGAGYLSFWAMMPDTVEYGEWRSGTRAEGAIFGLVSLIQKGSLGLAAGVLGELLSAIGYVPNQAQSAATLADMKTILLVAPLVCSFLAAALIWFYPLNARLHGRLVRALAWRKARR